MNELLEALVRLLGGLTVDLGTYAGVFCRMSAIAFLMPGLGEAFMPMRVRLVAALAFTALAAPVIAAGAPAPTSALAWVTLVGPEALVGLIIGFSLRLAVVALQMTGTIAAQHLQMSQMFGPGIGHDLESPLSGILVMAGIALAAAANLHVALTATLISSYSIFPMGVAPDAGELGDFAAKSGGDAIRLAFALGAPFVIVGVIYSIALGAMNRAMPSLMASFVGAPAILFAGLVLFAGSASVILGRWIDLYGGLVDNPLGGMQ